MFQLSKCYTMGLFSDSLSCNQAKDTKEERIQYKSYINIWSHDHNMREFDGLVSWT